MVTQTPSRTCHDLTQTLSRTCHNLTQTLPRTLGGKGPPDKFHKMVLKLLLPCFFTEKVHIKLGGDMEKRHRGNAAAVKKVDEKKK